MDRIDLFHNLKIVEEFLGKRSQALQHTGRTWGVEKFLTTKLPLD